MGTPYCISLPRCSSRESSLKVCGRGFWTSQGAIDPADCNWQYCNLWGWADLLLCWGNIVGRINKRVVCIVRRWSVYPPCLCDSIMKSSHIGYLRINAKVFQRLLHILKELDWREFMVSDEWNGYVIPPYFCIPHLYDSWCQLMLLIGTWKHWASAIWSSDIRWAGGNVFALPRWSLLLRCNTCLELD